MIRISPETRLHLQTLPARIREIADSITSEVYTQTAVDLSVAGDGEGLANVSATKEGDSFIVSTSEKAVITTPSDVPLAVQIAQEIARKTGRAPLITLGGAATSVINLKDNS